MTEPNANGRDLVGRIAELNRTRDLSGKPKHSLCYAPSVQMSFNTDGTVSVCCMSRHQPIGNVATDRLHDIWRGPRMEMFRQALAKDAFPRGCEQCRWELEMGNSANNPLRQFDQVTIEPSLQWPTRLEFAMSNLCNLGCVHCFDNLSSVVRARQGKPPMAKAYGTQFFADLREFLPHLQTASFLGGEPFLQPECFRVWDMLIEMGLRPSIAVTTNGTVWNERVVRVLDSLPYYINLSMDSVTPRNLERIRVNARAETVLRNVERFCEHRRSVLGRPPHDDENLITLNFVLMKRNWRDLAAGFVFAEQHQCGIWVTPLVEPEHLSVFGLSQRTLAAMARVLDQQTREIESKLLRNRRQWLALVAIVHKAAEDASSRKNDGALLREVGATNPLERAWAENARGDLVAALASAEEVPHGDPMHTRALVFRAYLQFRAGRLDECEVLLNEAERLGDRSGDLHAHRAWLRMRQGRLLECSEAIDRLDQVIASSSNQPPHWIDSSLELNAVRDEHLGQLESALARRHELLRRHPQREDYQRYLQQVRDKMAARPST
ncbi:MAG: radical SAM protein [Planctomycetes bacterium]|nr:radical SAM protein [Planctomycetota bacterium]